MKRCAVLVLFVCVAGAATEYALDVVGRWEKTTYSSGASHQRLLAAESKAMLDRLGDMAEVFHATPVMNPPRGFEPRAWLNFWNGQGVHREDPDGPARGWLQMRLHYYVNRAKGPFTHVENNARLEIWVNSPLSFLGDYGVGSPPLPYPDGRRYIYFEPRQTGEINGVPVYDGLRFVFAQPGRAVWVPVTRAEYLTSATEFYRKLADKSKAAYAPKAAADMKNASAAMSRVPADPMAKWAAAVEAELARLPPAEREAQAWYVRPEIGQSGLAPANSPGARALVTVNPDYFRPGQPRTAWQLITARVYWHSNHNVHSAESVKAEQDPGVARLMQMLHEVSWNRIQTMLAQ